MLCFPPWHNYKENRQTLPCPTICSWFCTQPKQPFSGIIQYFRNHKDSKSLVPEKCCIGKEISTISAYDQLKMVFQVSNVWSEQGLKHLEIFPIQEETKGFRGRLFIYGFSHLCFVWNFWEAFLDFYWEHKIIKTQNWVKTCKSFFSKCHKKRKLYPSTKSTSAICSQLSWIIKAIDLDQIIAVTWCVNSLVPEKSSIFWQKVAKK